MLTFVAAGLLAITQASQTPSSPPLNRAETAPAFQVATFKPSRIDESRTMIIRGSQFLTTGTTVIDLLKYAYSFHEQEIEGGPGWLKTQKFDVVADAEVPNRPSSDEFKKMVQDLLHARLQLTAHRELRELAVFIIVPAKSGPKLMKSSRSPNDIPGVAYVPGQLSAANATMADLAAFLQRFVTDRAVFDETGIVGKYDLTLRWTPDEQPSNANGKDAGVDSSLPGLLTAMQEQLGLKLQDQKRRAPVFVIDRVEMPTEN